MKWVKKVGMGLVGLLFLFPAVLYAQCSTCSSDVSFTANPEFAGPYAQTSQVDVNRGNSPATFVTAAYWQIYGSAPSAATVNTQVTNLTTLPYWRRIDVVNTFMTNSGRTIPRVYSEPWQSEPQFLTPPCKNVTRDVGAVCMFFFSCPGGTNCGMDWANTHVEGMSGPSTLLAYGANSTGSYTSSSNAGFWERELLDARYAGLSYLLPNAYGPDITDGSIANLASALGTVNSMGVTGQVKIGLFDDTSGWNNPADFNFAPWTGSLWTSASTLDGYGTSQINNAASIIYQDKWKAFFSQIPSQYWYEVNGHPLVYMYYGGTIPVDGSSQPIIAAIVAQIKVLFQADFGVTPYVVIDIGFSYGEANVADNQFVWNTLASPYVTNYLSTYTNNGVTADLAMVKWDPLGRDDGGSNAVATNYSGGYSSAGGVIKDDSYLKAALNNSLSANFLTLATWNDLGEGTGINRQYDYYVGGQWQAPDYFMNDIRHSQSQTTCVPTATPTNTSAASSVPTSTPTVSFTPTPSFTPTLTFTSTPTPAPVYAPCNGSVMTLNGILNESVWGLSSYTLIPNTNCNYGTGCGATDTSASAQFKAAWNSGGLWLGVVVSDPGTLYADTAAPWNGSGVEIFLDANNTRGGYNTGTGDYNDPNTYQWSITYNASAIAQYHNTTNRAIQAASVATAGTGYTMEVEIPWAALGVSAPVAGSLSGLDIAVDVSNAAGTARDHQIVAFNGSYNPYDQTPAEWGTLQYQTCVVVSNTPTSTSTGTFTLTPSSTPTLTATSTLTATPSLTVTKTGTASFTPTPILTATGTPTSTLSSTPSLTSTSTVSSTFTNTPVGTQTPVNTATITNTSSSTASYTPTLTATSTFSSTSTFTFTNTATHSPTGTLTDTTTPTNTATRTFTSTPTATSSLTTTGTDTATLSSTPTLTFTTTTTATPSSTPTQTRTFTSSYTATRTFTLTPTPTVTATFTSTNTATITLTPTNTWTPTKTGTPSPTGTASATPTPTGSDNALPVLYPNPSRGGSVHIHLLLPSPSNVTVEIFTTAFRKVQETVFPAQPVGVDMVVNLLDKSGIALADGLYYISVSTPLSPTRKITKLLILR